MSKFSELIKEAKGAAKIPIIKPYVITPEQREAGTGTIYIPSPDGKGGAFVPRETVYEDYYMKTAQAQAQASENSAAAENVPAPGSESAQAAVTPVYYYPTTTVKPRFGLFHVFLLVGSVYLLKKIFRG